MHTLLELADLAKAIGHPARVQILRLLLERNSCAAGDIFLKLPLAQSTVSQHLKVLRQAGLILGCEDGPRVNYCVDSLALARFNPKTAVAAHLRRCMTLEMALPFHRIMRLAAGPHLRFLRHHLGEMNCR
jgi:DNA-binding transcriptional ArsR family regulator